MTAARTRFNANLLRARYFLQLHQAIHGRQGAPETPVRELPRGAVVFAVGALDAYLSDVSAEVMIHRASEGTMTGQARDVMTKIAKELPGLALEVAVMVDEGERVAKLEEAVLEHFQTNVSQHGPTAVGQTVARMGGTGRAVWQALEDQDWQRPAEWLAEFTDVRHRMLHRGEKPRMPRNRARFCIDLLGALVVVIDEISEEAMSRPEE